ELSRPLVLPDLESDPAYVEASEKDYYMGPMAVFECQMFLPGKANFLIVAEDPLGRRRFMTSVGVLRAMLESLNEQLWQADESRLLGWYRRGLVSSESTQKYMEVVVNERGERSYELHEESTEHVKDKLEHNAQYAFACFAHACEFAEAHDVPIVIDE